MTITANPYLTFDNCKEAMTFYGQVFNAEPTFMPASSMPGMEGDERIMHAELRAKEITLMGSDKFLDGELEHGNQCNLGLMAEKADEDRAREIFQKLSEGGTVTQPLEKQPWGDLYGAVTDRFGFDWMMNVGQQ